MELTPRLVKEIQKSLNTLYECSECCKVHDYEEDARLCCAPEVYELKQCPICGKNIYDVGRYFNEEVKEHIEECTQQNPELVELLQFRLREKLGQTTFHNLLRIY